MNTDDQSTHTGRASVSAMFDSRDDAQRAIDRLTAAGIANRSINLVAGRSAEPSRDPVGDDDKSFWDSLGDFLFPHEDRYAYAEGLGRGGFLVTVTGLNSGQYDAALDILDDQGSVDLDERANGWRKGGWGGYEASSHAIASGDGGGSQASTGRDLGMAAHPGDPTKGAHGSEEGNAGTVRRDTSHGRLRARGYMTE